MIEIPYDAYSRDYLDPKDTDDDRLHRLREIIRRLPLADKKIFIMYMEYGTYSAVAKQLRCSVPTISNKIKMIKRKIQACI